MFASVNIASLGINSIAFAIRRCLLSVELRNWSHYRPRLSENIKANKVDFLFIAL